MEALEELEKLLDIPDQDFSWQDKAKCKGMTSTFFKRKRGDSSVQDARAKAICSECPVRKRCLDFAMKNEIRHGIWGGLLPTERLRKMGRKRWSSDPISADDFYG